MHTHSQEIANHYGVEETASLVIKKKKSNLYFNLTRVLFQKIIFK